MLRNFYRKLVEKLTRKYRIEIIDDITLSQSRQFALKPITVIWLSLLLFFSIIVGTASLVAFTPSVRKHIPGCLDPQVAETQKKLLDRLTMLERRVSEKDTIIKSLQLLAGVEGDSARLRMLHSLEAAREAMPAQVRPAASPSAVEPAPQPAAESANPASETPEPEPRVIIRTVPVVKASSRSPLLNLFPPLKGEKRLGFDPEKKHYGVDIVADEKAVIHAAADGFVVVSEFSDESGLMITIQSADNVLTIYKHNSRLLKQVGDYVYAGEPIAVIGNSGENTSGPHLHFELWHNGQAIDPINYIQFH
ncbi:MAG: hypothetical protein D6730_06260 [Bacteroidetes bacterium]|nr:MAG: hypothetical protein D6730_06260 [Bacteroidota bacterium]